MTLAHVFSCECCEMSKNTFYRSPPGDCFWQFTRNLYTHKHGEYRVLCVRLFKTDDSNPNSNIHRRVFQTFFFLLLESVVCIWSSLQLNWNVHDLFCIIQLENCQDGRFKILKDRFTLQYCKKPSENISE